jgi:hypothetical protein
VIFAGALKPAPGAAVEPRREKRTTSMKRRSLMCAGALAVAMVHGCADDPTGSASPIAVVSTSEQWSLTTLDDQPLPMRVVLPTGVTREVEGGRLRIESDWTWTFRFDHHDMGAAVDRAASSGLTGRYTTYGGEPTVMLLRDVDDRAEYTATVTAGASLVLTVDGHRYGFARAR